MSADIDRAVQASNKRMRDAIHSALDYCADTSTGDWQISYHEAVQRLLEILDEAFEAPVAVGVQTEEKTE